MEINAAPGFMNHYYHHLFIRYENFGAQKEIMLLVMP